jgi:hypothetical protein
VQTLALAQEAAHREHLTVYETIEAEKPAQPDDPSAPAAAAGDPARTAVPTRP